VNRSTFVERSDAQVARRFNALADPSRLAIIERLQGGIRCVCELRDELDMAPNLLSYHLRILREAGFVAGARNGRRIEYRILPLAFEDVRTDVERLAAEDAT
jgi:ArsR family transcriptional regulator